ncbi:MAG TPA: DUF2254 domain-containing protein [Methyloceanibacter sp.]|nr:DUF2254 domain-containing protein [Methyloceanibacter sp.]
MFPRILTLWHNLRTSLWALPMLMVALAAVAAILAVHVPLRQGDDPVWFLYSGDAEEAPQFLSNLVTAMITMATLVVSITMVVLTLAAQQLGPRLIRSFMADRRTQLTLGLFVSTVVYLLLVLRSAYGGTDKVPNLAVTGGTALVLLCLVALLIFVHHLARSIIADNTIDRVGAALDADIVRLLPEPNGEEHDAPAKRPRDIGTPLILHRSGYVQAVDYHGLIQIAKEVDAVIELAFKPGRHVIEGTTFAWIAPGNAAEEAHGDIEKCLVLGGEQASIQDVETSIRQLVEVAMRALSPSISDPFTALAVIDRLSTSVAKIMRRGTPQFVWADGDGDVRLLAPRSTFADTVEEAFRQIRQHSTDQPAVLIRLVESLGQLLPLANKAQQQPLKKEIEIVLETGRKHIDQDVDLATLEERAKLALKGAKTRG